MCQIVVQARKLSQKSLYHLVPIVPGIAYGRMIHYKGLYMLATRHHVESIRHPSAFHIDVIAIHPVNIRNLLLAPVTARQIVPKPLAPYDDVLRLVLFDDLEESLACLVILFGCTSLARTTHRHLQIVEEYHRVPDLQPHRLIGLLTYQRTLKLQESPHPVLPFLVLIEIIPKHLLRKVQTLPM